MITIPSVSQIRDQIIADIEAKIGQTVPALPKAFFRVLAYALAGVVALLYRFGAWAYDQIFPQTAASDALALIGGQYGLIRSPAVAAILTAVATGQNGSIIAAGTLWQSAGVVYQQGQAAEISGGQATITIEALTAGSSGNKANSETVSLATPLAGVDPDAAITATSTTGEDAEDIEVYRARIMARLANRPQGGAAPDYIGWALEVPGIVKAFAFRTGSGEVTVYPLSSLSGIRIPSVPKLAEVQAYLQDTSRRPLCASVYAAAMTERVITPTVIAVNPDTTDQRLAVESAWQAYLLRAFPVQYPDEAMPTSVISLAAIYAEALSAGCRSITVTMMIDGGAAPIESYTLADDEIVKLGDVTWPA